MSFINVVRLAAALVISSTAAQAAVFTFNTDPFAGSTALQTPGRQVVADELFIPRFDLASDVVSVNANVFNISPTISFFNGFAANLPTGGLNFIVLRDVDGDDNPANGLILNAILAANLIANTTNQAGSGFFIYFNSTLSVNRLVYSTDLDSTTADLKIIARFTDLTGQDAVNALPLFSAANFIVVPEPTSVGLMLAGLACLVMRHKSKAAKSARQTAHV